jgi:hypothetical protein
LLLLQLAALPGVASTDRGRHVALSMRACKMAAAQGDPIYLVNLVATLPLAVSRRCVLLKLHSGGQEVAERVDQTLRSPH